MSFVNAGIFRFEPEGKGYTFLIGDQKFKEGQWYSLAAAYGEDYETAYGHPLVFDRYVFTTKKSAEDRMLKTIRQAVKAPAPKIVPDFPIKKAWFNDEDGSAIVDFWDGDRVEVKAHNIDKYERGAAIAWAHLKKTCGSGSAMQERLKKLGAIQKED